MLKHETSTENQPSPAAQVRVTPEALAAAITALQIRNEGQPGTIAIGDAVEELGLDVSPEEVLAEVQARRREPKPKKKRDYRALVCAGVIASALATLGFFAEWSSVTIPTAQHIRIDQSGLIVRDAFGRQVFLSEVKDNQVFHCSLGGETLTAFNFLPGSVGPIWTLIKHDGKIYVRGWMPKVSDQVLQTQGTYINTERTPQTPVAVTLPVDGFKVPPTTSGAAGGEYTVDAENIHLDKHAYEKW